MPGQAVSRRRPISPEDGCGAADRDVTVLCSPETTALGSKGAPGPRIAIEQEMPFAGTTQRLRTQRRSGQVVVTPAAILRELLPWVPDHAHQ